MLPIISGMKGHWRMQEKKIERERETDREYDIKTSIRAANDYFTGAFFIMNTESEEACWSAG